MKKHILIIMGSPRTGGNTDTIAEILVNSICEEVDVEKINLSQFQFRGCRGCRKCFSDGICKIHDDMKKIYPLIEKADGFILISPTYNYNITAEMKAFIDRLFCFYDFSNKGGWTSRLGDKRKALIFGLCAGSSKEDMGFTLEAMERPLEALGIQIIKTIPYFNTRLKPVWENEEFIGELNIIGKEFANLVSAL